MSGRRGPQCRYQQSWARLSRAFLPELSRLGVEGKTVPSVSPCVCNLFSCMVGGRWLRLHKLYLTDNYRKTNCALPSPSPGKGLQTLRIVEGRRARGCVEEWEGVMLSPADPLLIHSWVDSGARRDCGGLWLKRKGFSGLVLWLS